ncbi:MAG: VRR-NUC domain-containing protein [Candidatus Omnitrophica bacterium]|nr:VRR-NUC domain-containing protein [Candidatus Omnitrophota bacterium]
MKDILVPFCSQCGSWNDHRGFCSNCVFTAEDSLPQPEPKPPEPPKPKPKPTKRPKTSEASIQNDIRLALGRHPACCLWRNDVGLAHYERRGRRYSVRYGLCPGSADLIGIIKPSGRLIALEIKTPRGRPSKEQLLFLQLVRSMGGFGAVVHSVEEAFNALERALEGANE